MLFLILLSIIFAYVGCQDVNCADNPEERAKCDREINNMQKYAQDNIFKSVFNTKHNHLCAVVCFTLFDGGSSASSTKSEKRCGGTFSGDDDATPEAIKFCGFYKRFVDQTLEANKAPTWSLEGKNFLSYLDTFPVENTLLTVILDAIVATRVPTHLLNLRIIQEIHEILLEIGDSPAEVQVHLDTHTGGRLSPFYPHAFTDLFGMYKNAHDKVKVVELRYKIEKDIENNTEEYTRALINYIIPTADKALKTAACVVAVAGFPGCDKLIC